MFKSFQISKLLFLENSPEVAIVEIMDFVKSLIQTIGDFKLQWHPTDPAWLVVGTFTIPTLQEPL